MKRRTFLKASSSALSLPVLVNGMSVSALTNSSLFASFNGDSDKVLILVQLNGGNDGLNMLIPLDQYDNLAEVRSNVLVPESSILSVEDTLGFHPNMAGMQSMYNEGQLGIIQNVGYANQNRSHFRSTDIWTSASAAEEVVTTGWLGRYFDSNHANFPDEYPNEDCPDPFAITIGSQVSETCQGIGGNFSLAINDPFNLNPLADGGTDEVPNTPYGDELSFLRLVIEQTNAYSDVITGAAENGNNMVDYPEDNRLAQQLKNVALLIAGGLRTKVYIVSLGGFDTHANQVLDGDTINGDHGTLLQTLSQAISTFQADLIQLGLEKRVVGMTFSEFGRRIRSNDSLGTDHGDAAPLMVFGSCIQPGVLGDNPEIDVNVGIQDAVPYQFDFRDVYGSILMDWFEVSEDNVKTLLFPDFTYLPIVNACLETNTNNLGNYRPQLQLSNFPNPFKDFTTIKFQSENEYVRLSVINAQGQEVEILVDKTLPKGEHIINFDGRALPAGNYYYQLKLKDGSQKTKLMTKLR